MSGTISPRRVRRQLANALDSAGMLAPVVRLRERWVAVRAPEGPAVGPDGIPMPPARLRVLVDGHGDPDRFLADADAAAAMIRRTLAHAGVDLAELGSILDFGCGCGRVARHWAKLSGPELHGCDYNPELVEWCAANLDFMEFQVNGSAPPSPYPDGAFDLVYAISIVTHMTEPLADAWIADFARVLKPRGLLLVTTHGDWFRDRLSEEERVRYDRGEAVIQRSQVAGTNACASYHPRSYVKDRLLRGFEVVSFSGDDPDTGFPQDVHLARRQPLGRDA
jgi:SAM-dependent methyltransferase